MSPSWPVGIALPQVSQLTVPPCSLGLWSATIHSRTSGSRLLVSLLLHGHEHAIDDREVAAALAVPVVCSICCPRPIVHAVVLVKLLVSKPCSSLRFGAHESGHV